MGRATPRVRSSRLLRSWPRCTCLSSSRRRSGDDRVPPSGVPSTERVSPRHCGLRYTEREPRKDMGGFAFRVGWKAASFPRGFVDTYVPFLARAFAPAVAAVSDDDFGWYSPLYPRNTWSLLLRAAIRVKPERGFEALPFFRVPCVALPGVLEPQIAQIGWSGMPLRVVGLQNLVSEWTSVRVDLVGSSTAEAQQFALDALIEWDHPDQLLGALAHGLDVGIHHAAMRYLPNLDAVMALFRMAWTVLGRRAARRGVTWSAGGNWTPPSWQARTSWLCEFAFTSFGRRNV